MTFGRREWSNHANPENNGGCKPQAQRDYHTFRNGVHAFSLIRYGADAVLEGTLPVSRLIVH